MREKQNDLFTIGVVAAILLIFSLTDFVVGLGALSSKNPANAPSMPSAAPERLLDGRFFEEYEAYVKGHFHNHDKWKKLWLSWEIALGKKDVNGVYLGRRETLFERHPATNYTEKMEAAGTAYLKRLTDEFGAKILLVPTSDALWKDRLPVNAGVYDQEAYLKKAGEQIGEEFWVDVWEALSGHAQEAVYYRTDPHWTALGAYYGYLAWWQKSGRLLPYYYDTDRMSAATERFLGELSAKSGVDVRAEKLLYFPETLRANPVLISQDGERREGYYREDALDGEDPYAYFLGEDAGFWVLQTGYERSRSLFLIGDSYANTLIPLIAPHYQKIYFLNPHLCEESPESMIKKYGQEEKTEVLVMQSVPDFLELFREK